MANKSWSQMTGDEQRKLLAYSKYLFMENKTAKDRRDLERLTIFCVIKNDLCVDEIPDEYIKQGS